MLHSNEVLILDDLEQYVFFLDTHSSGRPSTPHWLKLDLFCQFLWGKKASEWSKFISLLHGYSFVSGTCPISLQRMTAACSRILLSWDRCIHLYRTVASLFLDVFMYSSGL